MATFQEYLAKDFFQTVASFLLIVVLSIVVIIVVQERAQIDIAVENVGVDGGR